MLVKAAYTEYLKPGLARLYFYSLYGPRRADQSRRSFNRARKRAFETWIKTLAIPYEDEN